MTIVSSTYPKAQSKGFFSKFLLLEERYLLQKSRGKTVRQLTQQLGYQNRESKNIGDKGLRSLFVRGVFSGKVLAQKLFLGSQFEPNGKDHDEKSDARTGRANEEGRARNHQQYTRVNRMPNVVVGAVRNQFVVFLESNRPAPIPSKRPPSHDRNDKSRNGQNNNHRLCDDGVRNKRDRE